MRSLQQLFENNFGKQITLADGRKGICNVAAVLTDIRTKRRRIIWGSNLVTTDGDRYYATKSAGETAYFTIAGMRIGTNAGTATAPAKGDIKMQTTTGSVPGAASGSTKAIDATYPKTNDGDTDNTGAGVKIVTWRVSFTTAEANNTNIATIDLPDSLTDASITHSLTVANFAAKFDKTSNDTLKVFVNHTFNGV